jgi:tRNA 2-selenouridine synthase
LEKGYKAFRNFVLDTFTKERPIYILSGYTGSGKTQVLHELSELGEQVIDLEGLAHHKGSAFGHLGESEQPTGEQFQNLLGMAWYQTEKERPVWLEDESRFVGRRCIPQPFFKQMRTAPVFKVEVPEEVRIKRLAMDYGHYPDEKLKESILHIEKRLGGLRMQQALEAVEEGDLEKAAGLVLHYYDKAYDHQLQKRDGQDICILAVDDNDPQAVARSLLKQTKLSKSI